MFALSWIKIIKENNFFVICLLGNHIEGLKLSFNWINIGRWFAAVDIACCYSFVNCIIYIFFVQHKIIK